jgi:hypothetical protein
MFIRFLIPLMLAVLGPAIRQPAQPTAAATPPANENSTPAEIKESVYTNDLGFTYSYTTDWKVIDSKPLLPAVRLNGEDKAVDNSEKEAVQCLQVPLILRRGTPVSSIVTVVIPYDCLGKKFDTSDLANFGSGVASGMKRGFDVAEPSYGAYKLGTHNLWIERTQGTSKAHPDLTFKIETVCSLLKKGAVCWMGMVQDEITLKAFEQGLVSIEGDAPQALVPSNAFALGK